MQRITYTHTEKKATLKNDSCHTVNLTNFQKSHLLTARNVLLLRRTLNVCLWYITLIKKCYYFDVFDF